MFLDLKRDNDDALYELDIMPIIHSKGRLPYIPFINSSTSVLSIIATNFERNSSQHCWMASLSRPALELILLIGKLNRAVEHICRSIVADF